MGQTRPCRAAESALSVSCRRARSVRATAKSFPSLRCFQLWASWPHFRLGNIFASRIFAIAPLTLFPLVPSISAMRPGAMPASANSRICSFCPFLFSVRATATSRISVSSLLAMSPSSAFCTLCRLSNCRQVNADCVGRGAEEFPRLFRSEPRTGKGCDLITLAQPVGRDYGEKAGHFLEFINNFFFVIGHIPVPERGCYLV